MNLSQHVMPGCCCFPVEKLRPGLDEDHVEDGERVGQVVRGQPRQPVAVVLVQREREAERNRPSVVQEHLGRRRNSKQ